MDTLQELQSRLENSLQAAPFAIRGEELQSTSIQNLFDTFLPDGALTFAQQPVPTVADKLVVEGQLAQTVLAVPNPHVRAEFSLVNGNAEVSVTISQFPAGWKWSSTFPSLAFMLLDDFTFTSPIFNLDSLNQHPLEQDFQTKFDYIPNSPSLESGVKKGLSFSGVLQLGETLGSLSRLLGGATALQVSGPVEVKDNAPRMWLKAENAEAVSLGHFNASLALDLVSVLVELLDDSADTASDPSNFPLIPFPSTFARLSATLAFDTGKQTIPIPISTTFYDSALSLLTFDSDLSSLSKLGMDEVARLLGGTEVGHLVPSEFPALNDINLNRLSFTIATPRNTTGIGLIDVKVGVGFINDSPWQIIGDKIELTGLNVQFNVLDPTDASTQRIGINVFADALIAGKTIEGFVLLPQLAFSCELAPGDTIEIKQLLESILKEEIDMPAINCTEFRISGDVTAGSYELAVAIEDDWTFDLGTTQIGLTNLLLNLSYGGDTSLSGRVVGTINVGGIDIVVAGEKGLAGSGWTLSGGLQQGEVVDLVAVVNQLLPAGITLPDALRDMTIKGLSVSWNTAEKKFTFQGETAKPWKLDLGSTEFDLSGSISIQSSVDTTTNQRVTTGGLMDELDIGGQKFTLVYTFNPTDKLVKASWSDPNERLSYDGIARTLGLTLPSLDSILPDLGLDRASFEVDFNQAIGDTFVISAHSAKFGEAFFMARKDVAQDSSSGGQSSWGFAFGVALPSTWTKLSQIPDIGHYFAAVDFLEFEAALFMLSSADIKGFQVPDFPAIGKYPMQVVSGFTIGAVIDFTKAGAGQDDNSAATKNLHGITGKDLLLLSVTVSSNPANIALTVDLEGSVAIKGAGSDQISLSNTAVVIRVEPLAITLRGSVEFPIQDQKVLATGYLTISPIEAVAAFDVRAEDKYIPIPMGFKGVHLTEIGVEMGAIFEPPSVMLGLEGNFVIGETASPGVKPPPTSKALDAMPNADEFVFVFNATVDAVNPLLLSMYLEEVSLQTLITALLDHPVQGLPDVLTDIQASQLMLYWCDAPSIQQPDGTMARAGTGFNANLDLWGFHAHANLMIDPLSGIEGDAYMDPLHIAGVIDVTGDGEGTPDTYKGSVKVEPGGAVIHVSTRSSPFLNINWKITLFNLASQSVNAELTKEGFTFSIEYQVGTVFDSALSCSLKREGDAAALRMSFSIQLNVQVGPIEILGANLGMLDLTGVNFAAAVFSSVGQDGFAMTIDGSFDFDNVPRKMPQIRLSLAPKNLEELPQLIAQQIKDEAETIFKDLYDEARRYIQQGLDQAAQVGEEAKYDLSQITQDTNQLIENIKRKTDQDVESIASQADQYAQQTTGEANKLVQQTYTEMQTLERSYEETNAQVVQWANETEQEAQRTLQQGEQAAQQLTQDAANQARGAADAAGQIVNTVGQAVQEGANDVWNAVKKY